MASWWEGRGNPTHQSEGIVREHKRIGVQPCYCRGGQRSGVCLGLIWGMVLWRNLDGHFHQVYYMKLKCPAVCELHFRNGLFLFSQPSDLHLTISVRRRRSHESNTGSASWLSLSVLKSGEPPVYHDCFMVEQREKSAKRWETENETGDGRGVCRAPRQRDRLVVTAAVDTTQRHRGGALPYRLHNEANDHSQAHTATHHSYHYGCHFTCGRETDRRTEAWQVEGEVSGDAQLSSGVNTWGSGQTFILGGFQKHAGKSDVVLPEESSFPDSATNNKRTGWEMWMWTLCIESLVYLSRICCSAVWKCLV